MALKLLKINIASIEIKANPKDPEDIKEKVYEYLMFEIENEDLVYEVDEEESEDYEMED